MSVEAAGYQGVLPGHGKCLLCPWTASGDHASTATRGHTTATGHPSIYQPPTGAEAVQSAESENGASVLRDSIKARG